MMDTTGKFTSAALLDDLTGLYNRRYFYLRLDEEIKRSSRYGRPFCLLLMDLDNFKLINDSFGHLRGDRVLAEFARLLRESVRETDIACRYGGDEFALILPETDRKSSLKVANKIMEALKKTYFGDDMPLRLSISIGISSYPEDGNTPEELFNASDHALYFAKREGGNRVKFVEKKEMPAQETGLYLSPKFTGRDDELESLKKFFVKALQRKTTTVVISGEAGVGKTRLAREFLKVASLLGAEILKGKCYDFTKDIPYQPIKEALATFSEIDPLEIYSIIEEMPVLIRSEVLKILPFLDITRLKLSSEQIKTGREPDDKWRLFGGIKELFEGLERKRPLVLFFDDIHWADEASLELISFLARSIENKRILFLLAFREGEREKNPLRSFLNSFTKENNYHEIHLRRLKEEDVSRMLKSILGFNAPAELVNYLYTETEGNPFFIVEYVRRMADEGTISEIKKGSFQVETIKKTIPPGIKDIILARIAPLRDITKRILRIASVIGEEIDFNVLLAVSGINEGFLFDVLDELLKLKILREDLRLGTEVYSFTHSKIRDVVYEDMPHSLRKTLHRKIGNTLEEMSPDAEQIAEELAHHFLQAREEEKALKYLMMSARKAEKLYAFENALSHYEKALTLIPPSRKERLDIYMSMIPLLHVLGKRKREKFILEKAFALADEKDERYRELLRHRIKYLISLSSYHEAKELCESLLNLEKRAGKSPEYAETLMLLGKVHYLQAYYDTALKAFEEAAEIWKELGDNSSYAKALTQIARILNKRGQSRKSTEYLSRAFEVLQRAGDRRGMAEIYCEQGIIHLELSEFEKSREFFQKAHELYTEVGDKEGEARALHLEGNSNLSVSDYEEALSKFERALEIRKAIDDKRGMAASLANMGLIYQSTGNNEKAIEYYRSAAAIAEEIGDRDSLQVILNNMGTIVFNNDQSVPTDAGYIGALTGRDIAGDPNGSMTLNDIMDLYTFLFMRGFIPDTILMHPLAWKVFSTDPEVREIVLKGAVLTSRRLPNGGPAQGWPTGHGGLGLRTKATGTTGASSAGTSLSTSSPFVATLNPLNATFNVAPGFLPSPMMVLVSPFVPFVSSVASIGKPTTSVIMADSSNCGILALRDPVSMEEFADPARDIRSMKIRERYGMNVVEQGKSIAIAKNVVIDRNYVFENTNMQTLEVISQSTTQPSGASY